MTSTTLSCENLDCLFFLARLKGRASEDGDRHEPEEERTWALVACRERSLVARAAAAASARIIIIYNKAEHALDLYAYFRSHPWRTSIIINIDIDVDREQERATTAAGDKDEVCPTAKADSALEEMAPVVGQHDRPVHDQPMGEARHV